MRDAERLFAAAEDQRHDQILLVVEMPDLSFPKIPSGAWFVL